MSNKNFNFSEMVCFSLYSSSNAMIRKYRPQLKQFDLTYPQFLVMMSLWNKDSVYIKELSEQTYLDAGTLTQVLKRLESKGFIERKKSLLDERAKVIILTESGMLLQDSTAHIFEEMECKVKLTKEEQKEVTSICNKILSRLQ
jgi:DNA-binding MarR family transcriptional regulator